MTLKWSHLAPQDLCSKYVVKIYGCSASWLEIYRFGGGVLVSASFYQNKYVIGPGAFQQWAPLLKPQLWSHSHPISVEKETGWGIWTFILQDSGRGSCHLLALHPDKFAHIFLLAFLCVFSIN